MADGARAFEGKSPTRGEEHEDHDGQSEAPEPDNEPSSEEDADEEDDDAAE